MCQPRHRPPARILIAALAAGTVTGTLGACTSFSDAQQVIDRARLVNELASRLDHAAELTYTARYQLASGEQATLAQAQDPVRTAYVYPGGKYATTKDATIDCRSAAAVSTCTLTEPPKPPPDAQTGSPEVVREHGVVPPTLVVGLLTAASLSGNAVIQQRDTTIAGEHATCVEATGVESAAASAFDACITTAGVLGSVQATVEGRPMAMSLIRYAATVPPDAFDPPAGARLVDQRPDR
jgi:hypothetical protein